MLCAATVLFSAALLMSYLAMRVSPVHWPDLALFGLAYPIFLLGTLATLLPLLIRRSRWLWLPLGILLLGIPVHTGFFAPGLQATRPNEEKSVLRIMSYNVELFGFYQFKIQLQRRNAVFEQLSRNPADIYCFQEYIYTQPNQNFATTDTLVQLLEAPHHHSHFTHEVLGIQYFGIATFSRYPMVNRGVIEFPNDKNNICIYSDLLIDDQVVRVYNSHLSSIRFSGDEHEYAGGLAAGDAAVEKRRLLKMYRKLRSAFVKRAWQAELIRNHMASCPFPIILCGDFNDTPVSYTYRVFNRILNDTFRMAGRGIGNTYIGNFPSFRIDYVFTSNEFEPLNARVLPEKLSDHHALRVDVQY